MSFIRLKLSLKFFIAFISTSFIIVVIMVLAMQFYAYRNFSDYIHKVEVTRLSELSHLLSLEYQKNNGWDRLRDNPYRWHELIKPSGSAAYAEKPPSMPSGFEYYLKSPPPPPAPRERRGEAPGERFNRFSEYDMDDILKYRKRRILPHDKQLTERIAPYDWHNDQRIPPFYEEINQSPPPLNEQHIVRGAAYDNRDGLPGRPVFGIEHRIALFDDNKKTVIGRADSTEDHTLQKITVNGRTVGWLGLRIKKKLSDPLDTAFLKQQAQAFYFIGLLMLVLAAIVAFLLSRHLLRPVQELIKGTRNLTSRKFDTRIKVMSSDELGELARDFNQMARTLEHYEELRQQWISDIAHELRTPLSILRGEIEAIQDGVRDASEQNLQSLHDEVGHMIKIVSNLHELSLAESGALHIKKVPLDIVHIVRTSLEKFKSRFCQSGITILDQLGDNHKIVDNKNHCQDIKRSVIYGDKDLLTQVFSNLLENTLRYTDFPGCLTVRSFCTANEIFLIFADTKPAVPEESLEHLFDRLYRVENSRSRLHGGSGLGLSICKTIIEAHDGTIRAQNAPIDSLQAIEVNDSIIKWPYDTGGGLQIEIRLPIIANSLNDTSSVIMNRMNRRQGRLH